MQKILCFLFLMIIDSGCTVKNNMETKYVYYQDAGLVSALLKGSSEKFILSIKKRNVNKGSNGNGGVGGLKKIEDLSLLKKHINESLKNKKVVTPEFFKKHFDIVIQEYLRNYLENSMKKDFEVPVIFVDTKR